MNNCSKCGVPHKEEISCIAALQALIASLLVRIGDRAKCRGCNREIYFVHHINGKTVPYDIEGTNHFSTCTKADQFRRNAG